MGEWTTRLATAKLIGGHTGQEHTECSNKDENTPMIAARARACVCVCVCARVHAARGVEPHSL